MKKITVIALMLLSGFASANDLTPDQVKIVVAEIERRCLADDAEACEHLGSMYHSGYLVDQDSAMAFKWANKAAELGAIVSMHNVAISYLNGIGVKKNYAEAVIRLQRAANLGSVPSMKLLAAIYAEGVGDIKYDGDLFMHYLKKAALAGDEEAIGVLRRSDEVMAMVDQNERMPAKPLVKLPVDLVLPQSLQDRVAVVRCRDDGGSWKCAFRNFSDEIVNLGGYVEAGYDEHDVRIGSARTVREIIKPGEVVEYSFAQSGFAERVKKIVVSR